VEGDAEYGSERLIDSAAARRQKERSTILRRRFGDGNERKELLSDVAFAG
jgi:hypothetical protein